MRLLTFKTTRKWKKVLLMLASIVFGGFFVTLLADRPSAHQFILYVRYLPYLIQYKFTKQWVVVLNNSIWSEGGNTYGWGKITGNGLKICRTGDKSQWSNGLRAAYKSNEMVSQYFSTSNLHDMIFILSIRDNLNWNLITVNDIFSGEIKQKWNCGGCIITSTSNFDCSHQHSKFLWKERNDKIILEEMDTSWSYGKCKNCFLRWFA